MDLLSYSRWLVGRWGPFFSAASIVRGVVFGRVAPALSESFFATRIAPSFRRNLQSRLAATHVVSHVFSEMTRWDAYNHFLKTYPSPPSLAKNKQSRVGNIHNAPSFSLAYSTINTGLYHAVRSKAKRCRVAVISGSSSIIVVASVKDVQNMARVARLFALASTLLYSTPVLFPFWDHPHFILNEHLFDVALL